MKGRSHLTDSRGRNAHETDITMRAWMVFTEEES